MEFQPGADIRVHVIGRFDLTGSGVPLPRHEAGEQPLGLELLGCQLLDASGNLSCLAHLCADIVGGCQNNRYGPHIEVGMKKMLPK